MPVRGDFDRSLRQQRYEFVGRCHCRLLQSARAAP
jgi:hypothetical protein